MSVTHPARNQVLLGQLWCKWWTLTDTNTQNDLRLSGLTDHFTGQSPYPSLQGHCGPALS